MWLCISAVSDAKYRKIYNWIVLSGGVIALFSLTIFGESHPVNINLNDSLLGALLAFFSLIIFYKLKMTRREAMEHYLSVVRECMETGVRPRCHLEDITRSDIYGFVIPFCLELMKLMEEYGDVKRYNIRTGGAQD